MGVFNATNGNLLLSVTFHLTYNIVNVALLPVTMNAGAFGVLIALEWLIAAVLVSRLRQRPGADTAVARAPSRGGHRRSPGMPAGV